MGWLAMLGWAWLGCLPGLPGLAGCAVAGLGWAWPWLGLDESIKKNLGILMKRFD